MSTCDGACCAGVTATTPAPTDNPPGRPALARRVGTHGRFRSAMLARLSSRWGLPDLTTREPDDPAIALLDGWAVVADVLTFYQERIANEGYLRTAVEAESIVHLGRLVGHAARPALGAGVHLAYTLDPGSETVIPAGSRARSVPGPGELPQTFETVEDLAARAEWSSLAVHRHLPPRIDADNAWGDLTAFTVAGTSTNLKAADRVLFLFGAGDPAARVVARAEPDFAAGTTAVSLVPLSGESGGVGAARRDLRVAVSAALTTAPTSRAAGSTVDLLGTLRTALDSPTLPPPDDVSGWLPSLRLDTLVRVLPETAALVRARAGCDVVEWFETRIAAVLDSATRTLRLARAALREIPAEMAEATDTARELICPGSSRSDSPAAARPGVRRDPRPGEDCGRAAALIGLTPMLGALRKPPSRPPATARDLAPEVGGLFAADSDVHPKLLAAADPRLAGRLYPAWEHAEIAAPVPLSGCQVMRTRARLFLESPISPVPPDGDGDDGDARNGDDGGEGPHRVRLDAVYDGIAPGGWVIGEDGGSDGPVVARVTGVTQQVVRQVVGAGTVDVPITVLTLMGPWLTESTPEDVTVWAQGEPLRAVGDPRTDDVQGGEIELAHPYDGLRPGRLLIVSGERTDVPFTSGLPASELVMVGGVRQRVDPDLPGDTVHATVVFSTDLAYSYRRDTVRVHGNVVAATQGETRDEVLGSGDAARANQSFTLRQASAEAPLTWLPADNPLGARDELTVRVDGVRWAGTEVLGRSGPTDHHYTRRDGVDGTAAVVFGDGTHGARLPSGTENVTASYRVGAGAAGNVPSGRISQLVDRPLGVNGVVNPLPATGGSPGDGPDDARAGTPLRMLALDRLVSTPDYEDFARARAGIGKASARRVFDGRREVVHVTVAGIADVPIDPTSRLITTLESSLATFGDPHRPVRVAARDLVLIVLSAGVQVLPDHSWDRVEPAVRAAALDTLGFARRELGQPAYLSQVVAAMQAVPGVAYLDVDVFQGISGAATPLDLATIATELRGARPCVPAAGARYQEVVHETGPAETLTGVARRFGLTLDELVRLNPRLERPALDVGQPLVVFRGIRPAQLALLSPAVPETLTLRRIP